MNEPYRLDVMRTSWEGGVIRLTDVTTRQNTIVLTADLAEPLQAWSNEVLGYIPKLEIEHVNGGLNQAWLDFHSEADAILFRINFSHLWIAE